jgi:acetolactate decarboxylase
MPRMRPVLVTAAIVALTLLALVLPGCGAQAQADDTLYQYATLNALMAGVYDGSLTIGELGQHGDQGLGTVNRLDGEMVMIDGQAYRVGYDGTAAPLGDDVLTPFAVVTDFGADISLPTGGSITFDELKAAIDKARPTANLPFAIRIDGTFSYMRTRSVPAQTKPYVPLATALEKQSEFEFTNVKGTVVGFWLPAYMNGPNATGYHLHFLTADRKAGGHVLDCRPADVTVMLDETSEWVVELPTDGDFPSTELSQDQYK